MEKITILMAVYHPNLDWLAQQLESLEEQTYPYLELLIADDGPDQPVGPEFFTQHLHRIPFQYRINEKNLGTSRTYAKLIAQAEGEYVAFCDQDDRWKPEKLAKVCAALQDPEVTAAYCGLCVIDGSGASMAEDVRQVRTGDRFLEGDKLAPALFIKNSIYGCTLMLRTQTAQSALPLPEGFGFDHWFSLWAAAQGRLVFVKEPLIEYRIHGSNQSKPLRGIETREDYEKERIQNLLVRSEAALERFETMQADPEMKAVLCRQAARTRDWAQARAGWLHRQWRMLPAFIEGRKLSPKAFCLELVMPLLPDVLVKKLLHKLTA